MLEPAGSDDLQAARKRVFRNATVNIIAGGMAPPPGLQGMTALFLQDHFASPSID
ncbi:MAG: hypothetical protein ACREE6_13075 [Limisphaerales bacterium]